MIAKAHDELSPDDLAALTALLGGFAGRRVLCVGDVMVDRSIYGEVKRISPEAPVPIVRITRESSELGGAGNVARNLAALGARCAFVTAVGDDRAGREVGNMLARLEYVEPYLRVSRQRETTIKSRFFSLDGHHLLRADRESVVTVSADDLADLERAVASQIADADAIILSDYGKGVLTGTLTATVIAMARKAGKPVIVDPKGANYDRYAGANVITPNRTELAEATGLSVDGNDRIAAAATALRRQVGVDAVLVTRSGEGMTLVSGADTYHLLAETREVADVTGAGDTVVATLTLALASGGTLAQAARLANVAAGVVVGRHGTAVVTPQDIAAVLRQSGLVSADQKLKDRSGALARVMEWRRQGLKIGFTNGCFDLIHPGHVSLLNQASAACDRLIVGLNSDLSVKRLKGDGRPVQNEAARAAVMASLSPVDLVVIFSEDTPLALIEALRPDVLVKGADYTKEQIVGAEVVESYGGRVVLAGLVAAHSTSATIAAMKAAKSGANPSENAGAKSGVKG
ncbi:MAG: D-glycero-beta-D-manno-heptose-7-phosphate kinase [Rhodospirillaceae bacterium]|nr:D-glycero-beta-D-manno-heptose-7-phosphate kinase [Rhodospirillaceae bacterium]